MPETSFRESGKNSLQQCVFPPVTNWIRGFMDARFVVTDSFHGTVFSILFNKPFLAIGNPKRGMSRFVSLLKTFGLEDRLIEVNSPNIKNLVQQPIDFDKVNLILEHERSAAFSFLNEALSNQQSLLNHKI
jgi:exopolysaccharide biosynthesis predicted pyruvyltransferase EpsI